MRFLFRIVLLHFIALVLILTCSGLAHAARDCDSAALLEDLPHEDRAFLRRLCEMGESTALWRDSHEREYKRLLHIVAQAINRSEWEITALFRLLPKALFDDAQFQVAGCSANEVSTAIKEMLESEKKQVPSPEATSPTNVQLWLPSACAVSRAKSEDTSSASQSAAMGSVMLAFRAPAKARVLLLVGGRRPRVESIQPSQVAMTPPKRVPRNAQANPSSGWQTSEEGVRFALVPYNTPYAVAFEDESADGDSAPTIVRKLALGTEVISYKAPAAGCVDIVAKSEESLKFFIDGVPVDVDRHDYLYASAIWIPTQLKSVEHRLSVVVQRRGEPVILASQSVAFDPNNFGVCATARFDFTERQQGKTIGLLDVDADACLDAGLDSPKLRAYVVSYLEEQGKRIADLRSFSSATEYFLDFKKALDTMSASPVGANRGRLDSIQNLTTGAAELLRQGFASLLVTRLRCSRRGVDGWDFSFVAQTINLNALIGRARDPITGVDLDDVLKTEIELIVDRQELGPHIEATLANLFGRPHLALEPFVSSQPFHWPIVAPIDVRLPADAPNAKYIAAIHYRNLAKWESRTVCDLVYDVHSLRTRRDLSALDVSSGWVAGEAHEVPADGRRHRVDLTAEPSLPRPVLVRASLNRVVGGKVEPVSVGFQCVDLSRPKYQIWAEIQGWSPAGIGNRARTENSASFAGFIGFEPQGVSGVLSYGVGLGYSYTQRHGVSPSSWDGILSAAGFGMDGTARYDVIDHGIYVAVAGQAKASLCELSFGHFCNLQSRGVLLSARLLALPGVHFVDKSGVPTRLSAFRGDTTSAIPDVGLFAALGVSAQLTSQTLFHARIMFGSDRLFDYSRPIADAAVNRRALWGATLGATWEIR